LISKNQFIQGENEVKVTIRDINPMVKKSEMFLYNKDYTDFFKEGLLRDSVVWNFNSTAIVNKANIEISILDCYPNPFNNSCTINYFIRDKGNIELSIYSSNGQKLKDLVSGVKERGVYSINFDGEKLNSGIYFSLLKNGNKTYVKKIMLVK